MAKKPAKKLLVQGIGRLLTLEGAARKGGRGIVAEDLGIIENAALAIQDGRVVFAGPVKKLPRSFSRGAKVENVKGATVLPGLIESHTHLLFGGNRAAEFERRNQGESYQSIAKSGGGILSTVKATRAARPQELAKTGQARVERFLRQGVTTIEVKSGYGLSVDSELDMLRAAKLLKRARIVPTFLGAHAVPPEARGSAEAWVDEMIAEALPLLLEKKLASRVDIFVEDGYFDAELGRKYLRAAVAAGLELVVHADQLTHSGGARLAVELGARSADHILQIDPSDIDALAASEVTCVLLPSADLYMKCPYPPARELIDRGARVALATDFNPGSSPSADTALVGVLARVQMKMTLAEVIAAYTVGAAHALGLEKELGSLTSGKLGDFIVLEGEYEELFLEVGRQPVARVFREGRRLV